MRPTGILAILIGLATLPLHGQSQPPAPPAQAPPTFKVEVNYVEIDARVTDAQGAFVGDLTRNDFQVIGRGDNI